MFDGRLNKIFEAKDLIGSIHYIAIHVKNEDYLRLFLNDEEYKTRKAKKSEKDSERGEKEKQC